MRAGKFYPARMNLLKRVLVILAAGIGAAASSCAGESLVYFGTYTSAKSQGIYVCRFDSATGKLSEPELAVETTNPSFLAVAPGGHFLYAVGEGADAGAVSAFTLDARPANSRR